MEDEKEVKEKKWEHLAVRPKIFRIFRAIKQRENAKSDNSMMIKLIKFYRGEK